MNGTVVRLRPKGVEAEMDENTDNLTEDDTFEVYRVVDGVETVIGQCYPKRSKGTKLINLNWMTFKDILPKTLPPSDALIGDLVRKV